MLLHCRWGPSTKSFVQRGGQCRGLSSLDNRNRLSALWTPTGIAKPSDSSKYDSSTLLAKAGFIRQSGSGIFHLLPLGLRVQQKIENLISKHMKSLGASQVSLSSITSEALWTKSGRFNGDNPEMYRLAGNKGATGHLLGPTHEEEITEVVKSAVQSYRDLPVRLYQISRKYRNELRPRQGLLRAREFLMKDLYTFDIDEPTALQTYADVKSAYAAFFADLKVPYLVADADSGTMGGSLSHEFHFVSEAGEDTVLSCPACGYAVNEELTTADVQADPSCPRCAEVELVPHRAIELGHTFHLGTRYSVPLDANAAASSASGLDHAAKSGSSGPALEGGPRVPIQMGCHGIGVSRLIGAVTSILADDKGLNWPRAIAPFEVAIIPREGFEFDAETTYDALTQTDPTSMPLDVLLDDRTKRVSWKLMDADLIGYPVIVILGKAWAERREYEVQCRRLGGLRQNVPEKELGLFVSTLLAAL